jgi:hypothetical protein
MCIGSVLGLNG